MPTLEQANQHRAEVAALSEEAARELAPIWREFNTAEDARDGLLDLLPLLVVFYGMASASAAADWYDETRESDGIGGSFTAIPADLGSLGTDELARWAVDPLFQAEPDWDAAFSLVEGGMQKRIATASRQSLMDSTEADPQAQGWQRVTSPDACGFCRMLSDRGLVFTEATVNFGAHDACNCGVVPSWGGQPQPVKPYTKTRRNITAADRARTRKWMRENGYL